MQCMLDHPEMKMIKPSDTRWIAYQRSVTAVRKSLVPLQASLEHFHADSGDPEAKGVLKTMNTLKFVAMIHIMSDLLEPVTRLSRVMQAKTLDNTYLKCEVSMCEEALEALLANPAQGGNAKNIKQACENLDIPCTDESLDQFLTTKATPYISTVLNNIQSRFSQASHLLVAMSIFNPKLIPTVDRLADYGNQQIETLLEFYGAPTTEILQVRNEEDQSATVGPDVDPGETRTEWRALKKLLASEYKELSAQEVLQDLTKSEMGPVLYPNLTTLMTIALCLPVSTATVERSFSDMKMIKTRLRNRLSAKNLDHLMRISIEGPPMSAVDFDAILDIWKEFNPNRRIII
ncbi:uncharacterized protein C17orf113-like [Lineus longissimus]|uniref:uncharacterized protein C17orf113-like n=1 Tax=Lineus longissimus TaxID=88925 RepID=UPI00315D05F3